MEKEEKYILMHKNDEVLSFAVSFSEKNNVHILNKLEHFDKAPYGMTINKNETELNIILTKFINSRSIAAMRNDYKNILEATHCKSGFELSFKGHGLSLSNHYWYKKENENLKYEDINFFTNKWDDSFAKAVLKGDYSALENANLNVPDIVTPGWAVKGWLCEDDGPKLCKLGIDKEHPEECLGEVLASRLANRLFNEDDALLYELREINGQYASVSKVMIGIDEALVPLSNVLPPDIYDLYVSMRTNKNDIEVFFGKIKDCGFPELYQFFIKLLVLRKLAFVSDLHFENISMIRNLNTNQVRIAPIYDLAGAFGGSKMGRAFLSNLNKWSYVIVYFLFGDFKPDWDYSWYRPDRLIGFEDEIKNILSKSNFYTPELIDNIIEVYKYQKSSLDEVVQQQIK